MIGEDDMPECTCDCKKCKIASNLFNLEAHEYHICDKEKEMKK